MAEQFYIKIDGFQAAMDKLKSLPAELAGAVDEVLNVNASDIATKAKILAPVDMGGLHSSISADISKPLEKHIAVNAIYAAFVEFGTGKYAAAYAATLPANWQAFAAQFRGQKGSGTAYELWQNLIAWVHRHSQFAEGKITGTHSAKTGRRTGSTRRKEAENASAAYMIMLKILKNGVKAQPFLYPAYEQQKEQILRDLETVLKSL